MGIKLILFIEHLIINILTIYLKKLRFDYGVNLIKKGPEGAKECIKALKNKENLGMLIDQKMNDGLPVNFLINLQ